MEEERDEGLKESGKEKKKIEQRAGHVHKVTKKKKRKIKRE